MADVAPTDLNRVAQALPNYEITGELGRGSWGVVLEGRHKQLGRAVAVKQLPPAFASDPDVQARFFAEAKVLASLDHPHVVPIYDYVEDNGLCLLVMEKLTGGTVWSQFTTTGLTVVQACAITMAACAGLHSAHEHGVLHRDVKPENLMFSATNTVKVTDFGVARMIGGGSTMATRAGEILGTPAYMAPEQARNGELTPATDVYAVGVMVYELLSGHLPFPDEGDSIAMLFNHVYEDPTALSKAAPTIPEAVTDVVMKAMERAPQDRYQSADELGSALADAAQAAWGPGWLSASGVPVMATGRMSAATTQPGVAPVTSAPPGTTAPTTAAPGAAAPVTAAPGTAAPGTTTSITTSPTAPVRATTTVHTGKAIAAALQESDLRPIDQVVELPRPPVAEFIISVVLLVLAVLVAIIGLGTPTTSGNIPPRTITVAGADPSAGKVIKVDLSKPIVVAGTLPSTATSSNSLRLAFSAAGITLGQSTAKFTTGSDHRFSASFNTSGSRYLVAGRATGEVTLLTGSVTTAQQKFAAKATQAPLATFPGAVGLATILFLAGYPGSVLRGMRRGRRRVSGNIALTLLGGLFGLAAVAGVWLGAAKEPVIATLVVAILVGALGGLVAGFGGLQWGKRRRPQRVQAAAP